MPKTRIPYDAIYKNLFSNPRMVADLVCRFVPEIAPELDLSSLRRGPETHISERLEERFNDIVWTLNWKDGRQGFLVLMLEFQHNVHPYMALRMLAYTALLLLDFVKAKETSAGCLPPILPIVLYNGDEEWKASREVFDLFPPNLPPFLQALCPHQRHVVLDEQRLLKSPGLEDNFVTLLMQLQHEGNRELFDHASRRLVELLDSNEELRDLREAFLALFRCLAAYYTGDEEKAQALKSLMEAHKMLTFEERFAEYGDEWYRKGLLAGEAAGEARGIALGEARGEARGIALGEARGIALGEARGIAVGEARGKAQALQDYLQIRFCSIPQSLTTRIQNTSDAETLRQWTLYAYKADSLESFLGQMDGKSGK